jgi:ubiquinone biosynthesis protein COQ9
MKEIIYLNTDIMNSMLAQLEEGLIVNYALEQNTQESESEGQQSVRGKKAGLSGQVRAGTGFLPGGEFRFGASIGNDGSESEHESRTILEGQKDILNKAFHDYALEVLIKALNDNELINDSEKDFKEGDLHLGESTFRFYDFDLLRKTMDYTALEDLMLGQVKNLDISLAEAKKIVSKPNPNAKEREKMDSALMVTRAYEAAKPIIDIFKQLNSLSTFASNMLEGLTIIKTEDKIGLLKKDYLRESTESLSFRTDTSRRIKYLVRVIGKKEEVYDGFNIPAFKENDLDLIPNLMLDAVLGSFNIIQTGDLLVTPIAIYHE